MCTSSTATPAATGGSRIRGRGEERERRTEALASGGERAGADLAHETRIALDRASELDLDVREVLVETGCRADDLERCHGRVPTCSATMPPPSSR